MASRVAPLAVEDYYDNNHALGIIGVPIAASASRCSSVRGSQVSTDRGGRRRSCLPSAHRAKRTVWHKWRRCLRWRPSIQFLVPATSALVVLFIVVVSIVPTSVGWVSSLSRLSTTCKGNLLTEMNIFRQVVVEKAVGNISSLFSLPPDVATIMERQFQSSVYTGDTLTRELSWQKTLLTIMHPYCLRYDIFSALILAWDNSGNQQGTHMLADHVTYYSVYDSILNKNISNLLYDANEEPTGEKQAPDELSNYELLSRPWWLAGIAAYNGSWTAIYASLDAREGHVVAYVRRVHLAPVPAMIQITLRLTFLADFFANFNLTAHGKAYLTDDSTGLMMLAATPGISVRLEGNRDLNVTSSSDKLVSLAAVEWLSLTGGAHAEKHFTMKTEGETYYVDVSPITVEGNLRLWLFIVTPEEDFLGEVVVEQQHAVSRAYASLWSVLAVELFMGVVSIAASVTLAIALARSLRHVIQRLQQVSEGRFMSSSFSNSSLHSGMISELQALNTEVVTMQSTLQSFSKYVPTQVVQYLCKNKLKPVIGVYEVHCTVMFLDIADFTKKMDEYGVAVIVNVLGILFEAFSSIITRNSGIVDKYIGDAIMALWGCPENVENGEALACRAVSEIFLELAELNKVIKERHGIVMDIRIGMHSGDVQAGNIGSTHRLNYTVLGNTVNLASRLEPLNKEFGTCTLVSNATRTGASGSTNEFAYRALGHTAVRGFQHPVLVHEFLGNHELLEANKVAMLQQYAPVDEALCAGEPAEVVTGLLDIYLDQHPEDKVAKLARARMCKV
eukprot:TRINITY_DN7074_c0_g1_i1.p1 TRINITY_DN7074_c0_g1~~TRINITY_DN7074_c0_g1_i1.p1  ORF type:complete len:788 (+),score=156.11 TRINITY_DN7074_c0_g1_i1:25-2388(+)